MHKIQADLMLLAVTITAAAGWLFSKSALSELQPFWFIGSRFLLASFVLAIFCYQDLLRLNKKEFGKGIFTGSLFALAMMIWIQGLNQSSHVGEASFIVSLGVMLVPVFSYFILQESIPKTLLFSMPVAITGLAALNLQSGISEGIQWQFSQLTLLIAATFFALQFTITARFARSIAPLPLTTLQLFSAGIIAFSAALLTEETPKILSTKTITNVIAAAILASSIRFYLQTKALKYSQASHAGMILLLEPIWVTLMGFSIYGQQLNLYQFIGCGLIFTALLINRLPLAYLIKHTIQKTKPSITRANK